MSSSIISSSILSTRSEALLVRHSAHHGDERSAVCLQAHVEHEASLQVCLPLRWRFVVSLGDELVRVGIKDLFVYAVEYAAELVPPAERMPSRPSP